MTRYISVSMMAVMMGCANSAGSNLTSAHSASDEANKIRQEEIRRDQEVRKLEKQVEELAAEIKKERTQEKINDARKDLQKRIDEFNMDIR